MSEWTEYRTRYQSPNEFHWVLRGEMTLDLALLPWGISKHGHWFEMSRDFNPRTGEQNEVFWAGGSPLELRSFCRNHALPLPKNYLKYWRAVIEKP